MVIQMKKTITKYGLLFLSSFLIITYSATFLLLYITISTGSIFQVPIIVLTVSLLMVLIKCISEGINIIWIKKLKS